MVYPQLVFVRFETSGKTVAVSPGTTLLEAVKRAGIPFIATCGGQCECGECQLEILGGLVSPLTREESEVLSEIDAIQAMRLACCARVITSTIVKL